MKNLLTRLYNRIEEFDLLERIKCVNPFYSYEKIYRDELTGYPNARALRRDICRLSKKGKSVAIYATDIAGLKIFNEVYGHDSGNALIKLGLGILKRAVSRFEGKVYREYGDDYIAIIKGIDEEKAKMLPCYIESYCIGLLNYLREFGSTLTSPIDKILKDIPIHLHVGYTFSPDGKDIFACLDKSREERDNKKLKFYEKHPELDPRKSDIIARLKNKSNIYTSVL